MTVRLALLAALMLPALAALPSCSKSPAEAQQRGDSTPPKPMPPPQVVKPNANRTILNAASIPGIFKTPTQLLINTVRDKARREWRKDAVVTNVAYHWSQRGNERVYAWAYVTVDSVGDGAQRNYSVGDIYDGQVLDFNASDDNKKKAAHEVIGDIKFGLTEAAALLKRLGYDQEFDEVELTFVGKGGKRELPAFRFLGMRDSPGGAGLFPLTYNAMTGRIMDWRDAYRTPDWSDAQIAAIFARLRNPQNQPKTEAQMVEGAVQGYNCVSTGGTFFVATSTCSY